MIFIEVYDSVHGSTHFKEVGVGPNLVTGGGRERRKTPL